MNDPQDQPTRQIDPGTQPARPASETDPTVVLGGAAPPPGVPPEDTTGHDGDNRRLRTFVTALVGAVIGFAAAFVVVALASGDRADDTADLDHLAALEAEIDERDARIVELDARIAEAEAAAGGREEDIAEQRRALDERAAALEEWSGQLSDREAAIADRERALAEREAAHEESGNGLPVDIPEIDDATVDSIVDRVIDQIRELFGR